MRVEDTVTPGLVAVLALSAGVTPWSPAPGEVLLEFVGDVMLDDGPGKTVSDGRDPFAGFQALVNEPRALVNKLVEEAAASANRNRRYGTPYASRNIPGYFNTLESMAATATGVAVIATILGAVELLRRAVAAIVGR